MIILIVVLHIIVSLFLIAVILLQAGRGQGLSWGVFGGNPQSILGTKAASFLSRVTTGCAIVFLFTVITLNIIEIRKARSLFAPRSASSKIDLAKLSQALEEAAKAKKTTAPINNSAATKNQVPLPTSSAPAQAASPQSKPVSETTQPAEHKSS